MMMIKLRANGSSHLKPSIGDDDESSIFRVSSKILQLLKFKKI